MCFFQVSAGDTESIDAVRIQRDHLALQRTQALKDYNESFQAMEGFKTRACQWADYSNLKELTDEEQVLFDEVNFSFVRS